MVQTLPRLSGCPAHPVKRRCSRESEVRAAHLPPAPPSCSGCRSEGVLSFPQPQPAAGTPDACGGPWAVPRPRPAASGTRSERRALSPVPWAGCQSGSGPVPVRPPPDSFHTVVAFRFLCTNHRASAPRQGLGLLVGFLGCCVAFTFGSSPSGSYSLLILRGAASQLTDHVIFC